MRRKHSPGCRCCSEASCECQTILDFCEAELTFSGDTLTWTFDPNDVTWLPGDFDPDYEFCIASIPNPPEFSGRDGVDVNFETTIVNTVSANGTCSITSFGITYDYTITADWLYKFYQRHVISLIKLTVRQHKTTLQKSFRFEAVITSYWEVRPYLDGTIDVDISETPSCAFDMSFTEEASAILLSAGWSSEECHGDWIDFDECSEIYDTESDVETLDTSLEYIEISGTPSIGSPCATGTPKIGPTNWTSYTNSCTSHGFAQPPTLWLLADMVTGFNLVTGAVPFTLKLVACP